MRLRIFLLWVLLIAGGVFNACNDDDYLTLVYKETKCSNPWGEALIGQENYYVVVRGYLFDQGVQVEDVSVEVYDSGVDENCKTCDCITGRDVVLVIPVRDAKKAEEVGFVFRE